MTLNLCIMYNKLPHRPLTLSNQSSNYTSLSLLTKYCLVPSGCFLLTFDISSSVKESKIQIYSNQLNSNVHYKMASNITNNKKNVENITPVIPQFCDSKMTKYKSLITVMGIVRKIYSKTIAAMAKLATILCGDEQIKARTEKGWKTNLTW